MVLDQLEEELVVVVGHHIIVAQARAHKDLFDARDRAQPAQQGQIVPVVGLQVFAGGGEQAALIPAQAVLFLVVTRREAEVCRRAADVVDIALEVGVPGDLLGLAHDRIVRAGLDIAALMEGQGAEVARAEAAAVVDDGKLHLLDGGHAAGRLIGRMIGAGEGQGIDLVHFGHGEWQRGWVLDQDALAMRLDDRLAAHVVGLVVLHFDRARIGLLAVQHFLVGRAGDKGEGDIPGVMGKVGHAADAAHGVRAVLARLEVSGQLDDRALAHAIHERVRARRG